MALIIIIILVLALYSAAECWLAVEYLLDIRSLNIVQYDMESVQILAHLPG